MNSKKVAALLLAGLALLGSCKNNTKINTPGAETIDTSVVLSVGKVNITAYEFEKNLKAFKQTFLQKNGRGPQPADIQAWKNDFINRAYFLADAYAKGYDKDKHIDTLVESAAHQMISQPHGLLEQKLNESIRDSKEVTRALKRSKKVIHIEYLKFSDRQAALKILNNTYPKNGAEFKKVLGTIDLVFTPYRQESLTWPFNKFFGKEEYIFNMKKDEVSPLLELNDGYYIFHVENIDYLAKPKLTEKAMQIHLDLTGRQKIMQTYYTKILLQARPEINNNIANVFARKLNNYTFGTGHTFIKKDFSEILHQTIVAYTSPGGKKIDATVADFIDYYNTLFIKANVDNVNDVVKYLNSMALNDYFYDDAVKMGIVGQPKFLLDKNNFKNELIYHKYETDELSSKEPITSNEIMAVYNSTKSGFVQATDAVVSLYYFGDRLGALTGMMKLRRNEADIIRFDNLVNIQPNMNVNYKAKTLADTLMKLIFRLKDGEVAMPVNIENNFVVIKKETEAGNRVENLNETKGMIINRIQKERLLKNKAVKIAKLKVLYNSENKIPAFN